MSELEDAVSNYVRRINVTLPKASTIASPLFEILQLIEKEGPTTRNEQLKFTITQIDDNTRNLVNLTRFLELVSLDRLHFIEDGNLQLQPQALLKEKYKAQAEKEEREARVALDKAARALIYWEMGGDLVELKLRR